MIKKCLQKKVIIVKNAIELWAENSSTHQII
nr:MAG TPA: hypothetical protein [Caudoviricetes sp.]